MDLCPYRTWTTCLILQVLLLFASCTRGSFVNTDVERRIDVRGIVETSTIIVTMRNTGDESESDFHISLNPRTAHKMGDIFAAQGNSVKADGSRKLKISTGQLPHTYIVTFEKPVPAREETTIALKMDILSSLQPVPAQIKAHENQYIRYTGDAYFYSPYVTERMQTTLMLPTSTLENTWDAPKPYKVKPYQLVLGHYTDVPPFASAPLAIRYKNNQGFLSASRALMQYSVSHWGSIATREEFTLTNVAATLVGEWSRVDYDRRGGKVQSTAHGDVWANLPADAQHIAYKDLIGNITTSRLRKPSRGLQPLQLTFRFPLLGGWRNHFWYTYSLLLENYINSDADTHTLTLPALPSLNYDLPCEHYELRIVLPESATDIQVDSHRSIDFKVTHEETFSTMSYFGRPTLVLRHRNLRTKAPHAKNVVVRYTFSRYKLFIAPAIVTGGVLALLVAMMVFVRTNLVLVRDVEGEKRKRSLQDEMEKVVKVHATIFTNYYTLQQLYNDVCRGTAENVDEKRNRIADNIIKQERVLSDICDRLLMLNSDVAGKLQSLSGLLSEKRECSMNFLSIENRFHTRVMSKARYEEEMRRMAPLSQTLSRDVANLFQSVIAAK